MPQGLEVFDGAGVRTFATSDRFTRYLGSVWTGTDNGAVGHGGFATGAPWYAIVPRNQNEGGTEPDLQISGTTLSWSWSLPASAARRVGVTIVYGVR